MLLVWREMESGGKVQKVNCQQPGWLHDDVCVPGSNPRAVTIHSPLLAITSSQQQCCSAVILVAHPLPLAPRLLVNHKNRLPDLPRLTSALKLQRDDDAHVWVCSHDPVVHTLRRICTNLPSHSCSTPPTSWKVVMINAHASLTIVVTDECGYPWPTAV
jgi:hypothetical protein